MGNRTRPYIDYDEHNGWAGTSIEENIVELGGMVSFNEETEVR